MRFVRGVSGKARKNSVNLTVMKRCIDTSEVTPSASESPFWQYEYEEALMGGGETERSVKTTYRDHALLSGHRQDGVVAPWTPGSGVNEEMDGLVRYWGRRQLREHDVQVNRSEDLLQGVECETTQFALDEVGAVLHDCFQLDVPFPALPARYEVKHVGALGGLAVLPAGVAGESNGECGKEGEVCSLVPHSEKTREEVDLAGNSGNGQEAGGPHNEEGEYCFVRKI